MSKELCKLGPMPHMSDCPRCGNRCFSDHLHPLPKWRISVCWSCLINCAALLTNEELKPRRVVKVWPVHQLN